MTPKLNPWSSKLGVGRWADYPPCKNQQVTHRQQNKASEKGQDLRTTKRTPKKVIRLGTWNVRTLAVPGASEILSEELKRYKMDIVALQEIRWPQAGRINTKHYYIYYSGCEDDRYYGGVGFAVSKRIADSVICFEAGNERICNIRFKGKFKNISVISFYAPTEDSDEETKDNFYELLDQRLNSIPNYDMKIVLGDANAKIGKENMWKEIAGKESLHDETNENGVRLCSFAMANNLKIVSTCFPRKEIHKETWISPDGRTKNQIDHVLVDNRNKSSILNVRSIREAECGSDHNLVLTKIYQRISIEKKKLSENTEKIDIERLKDKHNIDEYKINLQNRFQILNEIMEDEQENMQLETLWKTYKTNILETAKEVCGKKKRRKEIPWLDEECTRAIQNRAMKKKKWLNSNNREDRETYQSINKSTTRLLRRKKREYINSLLEKAENDQKSNNHKEFYSCVKHFRKGYTPSTFGIKNKDGHVLTQKTEVVDRWKEYFSDLLNGEEMDQEENREEYQCAEPYIEEPSKEEVEEAIKDLKNNKAAGEDMVVSEMLKGGGKICSERLHKIILKVWKEEKMPEEWLESIIVPIYKKGDKGECSNYRGISLLSHGYKVLSKIIQKRLEQYTNTIIEDHQAGFVKGRSTTDQIFILKQAISKYWEYNKEFHGIFIDFSKAYDSLDRAKIWDKMKKFGVPRKLINLIKMTIEGSRCKVKIDGTMSESFEVKTGVRQGDGLSPILFNIAIEDALQKVRRTNKGLKIGTNLNILAFADDVAILCEKKDDLKNLTKLFIQETSRMGLKINDEKTKYMHFSKQEIDQTNEINIDGHSFEKVDLFKYLGILISSQNSEEPEINNRINQANKSMYACNKILTSKILSRQTKFKVYHTIIRPVLLYGAETWILNKKEERKLIVFENKILRKIFGPVNDNGEWRIRHNEEIRNLYRDYDYDITAHARVRRLRWAGHVLRRDVGTLLKEVGEGQPNGRRPPGRPKRRWWDSVKTDIVRAGAEIEEAYDRERWRAFVGEAKTLLGYRWPWE